MLMGEMASLDLAFAWPCAQLSDDAGGARVAALLWMACGILGVWMYARRHHLRTPLSRTRIVLLAVGGPITVLYALLA